jgi:hypothetical protein
VARQVAAQPEMAALLSGFIYSSEGQEIYLRRPLHYHLPDHSVTFSEARPISAQAASLSIKQIRVNTQ